MAPCWDFFNFFSPFFFFPFFEGGSILKLSSGSRFLFLICTFKKNPSDAPPCGLRTHQDTHTRTHPDQLQILAFVGFAATRKNKLVFKTYSCKNLAGDFNVYFGLGFLVLFLFFLFCFTGNQELVLELDLLSLHFFSGLDNTEALCFSTWIVFSC